MSPWKRRCDWYIAHAKFMGALYCVLPALLWFGLCLAYMPFREVYVVRLLLSAVVGGWIAALVNEYGLRLWIIKHRAPEGPATVADGALIGASIGLGVNLLPPLTTLIATNHLDEVVWFVLGSWIAALVVGGGLGALLATVGIRHVERPAGAAPSGATP